MRQAVDAFLESRRQRGLVESSIDSYEDRLEILLGPAMARSLRWVAGRGAELYAAAQAYPDGHRRSGRRAADTHRNALAVGRTWGRWCVKHRWLRADPFEHVEPMGAKTFGGDKPRLTVTESRRLQLHCHGVAATDPGAVLTLGYLLLGPRASELVLRVVRDLDDGGRLLWIGRTKTKAGRRRLLVPDELRPLLVTLAGDRAGDAPLFAHADGTAWSRFVARDHVLRVCADAKVPVLPPQALRRTQATLATDAGATALDVARHLGHAIGEAPAVTGSAYVGRDATTDAANARAWKQLGNRDQGDPN